MFAFDRSEKLVLRDRLLRLPLLFLSPNENIVPRSRIHASKMLKMKSKAGLIDLTTYLGTETWRGCNNNKKVKGGAAKIRTRWSRSS